jgi:hypothetical protein
MQTRTKKKLAFIDHSFHRVTRSSEFFQEKLRCEYEIAVFFDDAWRGGSWKQKLPKRHHRYGITYRPEFPF